MLAAARFLLGQTQAEVAERSGLGTRTVHMVENGTAGIASVEKLVKHYASCGLSFSPPQQGSGWGIRANFVVTSYDDERPE